MSTVEPPLTLLDRLQGIAEALGSRSPIIVTTRKRRRAHEHNAFLIGVDWGTSNALAGNTAREVVGA